MTRRALIVLAVILLASSAATARTSGDFTFRGTVVQVIDGDTIDVRLLSGKRERIRLIGIDTPERGACFASKATARTRALALSKRVTLKGDRTQDTRDRYGRLLAYVWLPGAKDLGFQLVKFGAAKVYVYERPFLRLAAYENAETAAKRLRSSVWTCGKPPPPPPPPPPNRCDPSYPTVCIPPYSEVGDLDCADVPYTGFAVVGSDPHGFDGDGDGVGCEP